MFVGRGDRSFAASGGRAVIPVTSAVIHATGAVVLVTDPVMDLGLGHIPYLGNMTKHNIQIWAWVTYHIWEI